MAQEKGTQQGGLMAGGLGGGFLGFILGLIAARPAQAAPPEGNWAYLLSLLEGIAQGVGRLVDIAEGIAGSAPPYTINIGWKPGMVFVPQDPETLNGIIQAMRLKGLTLFSQTRLSWALPFGVTTDFTLTMPLNFYDTRRYCLITSDFYDPLIILNVWVDGELATPQGVAITGPTTIDFGEYYVKKQDIRFSTANGTVVNAVMSLQMATSLMEKSFYDEFYAPLMTFMYDQLKEVVSANL